MNITAVFPYPEWVEATKEKLNSDERYAEAAKKWEGDMRLVLQPDEILHETVWLYWDFWHGKCREAYVEDLADTKKPTFILVASYGNFVKILSGEVGAIQALMGRMVGIKGNIAYMMRNVPTVVNFVRCCQEVTHKWL